MPLPAPYFAWIDLWLVPVPEIIGSAQSDKLAAVLSRDERARLARFRLDSDRRQFLLAHGVLRQLLTRYHPEQEPARWRFVAGRFGKPCLADGQGGVNFNLSHTEGMIAIAVTGGAAVGVDVERRRPLRDVESLLEACLSGAETRRIRRLSKAEHGARSGVGTERRFHESWTLKEAYLKALGVGLSRDLNGVELRFDEEERLVAVHDAESTINRWRFAQALTDDGRFALAVAMPCPQGPPSGSGITLRTYVPDGYLEVVPSPSLTVRDVPAFRASAPG